MPKQGDNAGSSTGPPHGRPVGCSSRLIAMVVVTEAGIAQCLRSEPPSSMSVEEGTTGTSATILRSLGQDGTASRQAPPAPQSDAQRGPRFPPPRQTMYNTTT
ncbi:hypothetical protein FOZ63_007118 [Perkinsus olseni]|uniref:Uncharacterized protein n=1 Tax=Perkinsus olseni TaxID=32597 RepID=A0A7J6QHC3_PEROL|nr:hypothetical protein FOZ63_007118 [Perkinsus olseni]